VTAPTPFWRSVEALNNFVYLVPEAQSHYKPIGLKGSWMGYFASRSAPMGAASPELVIATFHGFAPHLVRRAIPDAWTFASPDAVLAARLALATEVLGRAVTAEQAAPLAAALEEIVAGLDFAGKPLAAAHASLPLPDDELERFWLLDAVVREFRGDCHVALLVAWGLNGVDANLRPYVPQPAGPAGLVGRRVGRRKGPPPRAGLVRRRGCDHARGHRGAQ
jgi:hypothetical protein